MAAAAPSAFEIALKSFTSTFHNDTYSFIGQSNHRGHSVFITGGSRGIGRSIATSFAQSGASHIGLGDVGDFGELKQELLNAAASSQQSAPKILLLKLDVTDKLSVASAAQQVRKEFGNKLDILINNAGAMSPPRSVIDSDEDAWWHTLSVNLRGVYQMSKHFTPIMVQTKENGLKTIVNINSIASIGVRPQSSDYGTSKLAVLKFTEHLLVESAENGLLAYSVHPGAIFSEMAQKSFPEHLWPLLKDTTQMAGDTVAWLTEERREWLAGRWICCNWDMEELLSKKAEIEATDRLKVRFVL